MNKRKRADNSQTHFSNNYLYYKSMLSQLSNGTQNKIVLNYLLTHSKMTTFDAYEKFGITRLPSRVNDLRNMGVEIECNMKYKGRRRWGEYKVVM